MQRGRKLRGGQIVFRFLACYRIGIRLWKGMRVKYLVGDPPAGSPCGTGGNFLSVQIDSVFVPLAIAVARGGRRARRDLRTISQLLCNLTSLSRRRGHTSSSRRPALCVLSPSPCPCPGYSGGEDIHRRQWWWRHLCGQPAIKWRSAAARSSGTQLRRGERPPPFHYLAAIFTGRWPPFASVNRVRCRTRLAKLSAARYSLLLSHLHLTTRGRGCCVVCITRHHLFSSSWLPPFPSCLERGS
jgi:hypothetical protein